MLYTRHIPEHRVPGKRLGRHVAHDPRSLRYLFPAHEVTGLTSVRHQRYIPVLDQGDVGSCTGNAALGAVGTGALFEALNKSTLQPSTTDAGEDEQRALGLYSAATKLDDYPGSYPPDDTGSDGLSVAKAATKLGLISGYTHATSLDAALKALSTQAVITGVNWYDSFDEPNHDGLIAIGKQAQVRGGHEFVLDELLVDERLVGFTNSWSPSWGAGGRAYLSWDDFERLLSEDGDVTAFVPATAPAPTPDPDPAGELVGCLSTIVKAARRGQQILKGK